MLDVDEQGWLHVAYYQNEIGSVNGGVLNASVANLYYTYSTDGGASWSLPVQVNDPSNALDYKDPPPDFSPNNFYLIGDYQSIQAAGADFSTKAYILWTGYDKDRSDTLVGDTRARVWCTTIQSLQAQSACLNDTEPPTATCPATTVKNHEFRRCDAVVTFTPGVRDNCPSAAVVCAPPSGSTFPAGNTPVTCIAADGSGNADTCAFTVTVSGVKGDLNNDNTLTPFDVMVELNNVFLEIQPPAPVGSCACDLNCDGFGAPSDVVLELNAVFLGASLACP